ncbi:uncharacterized protein KY384_008548 [Bacidia gigantensis]|uniref:uncharacterized protein n=1 Tax=Bacidia gigantensis TaxID=2732470 RepID=UPI001D059B8C|nr:uncharacterized protein KY384_008548 [Bacidia gigantensis]KAG8527119.1 hypothetical protein KY384_008548 [Bacidia gigantensis]
MSTEATSTWTSTNNGVKIIVIQILTLAGVGLIGYRLGNRAWSIQEGCLCDPRLTAHETSNFEQADPISSAVPQGTAFSICSADESFANPPPADNESEAAWDSLLPSKCFSPGKDSLIDGVQMG